MVASADIVPDEVELRHQAHREVEWEFDCEGKDDAILDGVVPQPVLIGGRLDERHHGKRGGTAIVAQKLTLTRAMASPKPDRRRWIRSSRCPVVSSRYVSRIS
jgi:hypothetical protein